MKVAYEDGRLRVNVHAKVRKTNVNVSSLPENKGKYSHPPITMLEFEQGSWKDRNMQTVTVFLSPEQAKQLGQRLLG